jgi:hypothetical protein
MDVGGDLDIDGALGEQAAVIAKAAQEDTKVAAANLDCGDQKNIIELASPLRINLSISESAVHLFSLKLLNWLNAGPPVAQKRRQRPMKPTIYCIEQ